MAEWKKRDEARRTVEAMERIARLKMIELLKTTDLKAYREAVMKLSEEENQKAREDEMKKERQMLRR